MIKRINLIKKIDSILGPFFVKILPVAKNKKKVEDITKIMVVRPGGLGDAALLLPVLKAIKIKYPQIKIDVLCEFRNIGVFQATDYIDEIYLYDSPLSFLPLFRKKYDAIFDTEQSHYLSSFICRLMQSKFKVGFDVNGRGRLFNRSVKYYHELYEADSFFNLFNTVFDLPESIELNPPYFKSKTKGDTFEKIFEYVALGRIVCVFTGATTKERLWPVKRWVEVIDALGKLDCCVVLLGGAMEKKQNMLIKSLCKRNRVVNMTGRLSLLQTSWLFKRANLLISTDSGILHLGVLSGIPTVSLFGPGISAKWAPQGEKHLAIKKEHNCSPCTRFGTTPECQHNNICMMSISSDDIFNAVLLLFEKNI